MAARVKDETGRSYGKWEVLRRHGKKNSQVTWWCRCECGTEREIRGGTLRSGLSQSCGECLDRSDIRTTHGLSRTKGYHTWRSMIDRCQNPLNTDFAHYGGRGIAVCERWLDVSSFIEDMGQPEEGETLDRIDVQGNYCPENCRWTTQKEQTRNARSNINLHFDGRTQCIGAWAEEIGIKYGTLYGRVVTRGWSTERALTTPVSTPKAKSSASTRSCDE